MCCIVTFLAAVSRLVPACPGLSRALFFVTLRVYHDVIVKLTLLCSVAACPCLSWAVAGSLFCDFEGISYCEVDTFVNSSLQLWRGCGGVVVGGRVFGWVCGHE